ncbi:hypothetical protein R6Q57_018660 [Mikania cordata]
MEGGSSRGGSSSKKFRKPRPKNVQTAHMNPFNTLGALNNNLIGESNRINKINKVINNSINKLFNNNLHFKTIVTIIKMTRIQTNIIKVFKSSRKKKNRLGERERKQ